MILEQSCKKNNDRGFSLVELIVCVSILAIAAVPLYKSMSMSARVNAKAQSIQNATSLAESVMEEMKSTPLDKLQTRYGTSFTSGVMTITKTGVTATQGETFDATVTINANTYADSTADTTTKAGKVKQINMTKLPSIEEIDTLSQAVLSSTKEFNRYDAAAQSYFNEKKADFDPSNSSSAHATQATITSKTIDIVKENVGGAYNGVTVKATVKYEAGTGNEYIRDLYTGSFIADKNPDDSYKPLDSNIYIFYTMGEVGTVTKVPIRETINIKDSSTPSVDPAGDMDSHRVYFIRQKTTDNLGPLAVNFSGIGTGTFKYDSTAGMVTPGEYKFNDKIKLITNVTYDPSTLTVGAGHVYKEEEKNRVYDITVVLTKPGDATEYAKLNSTITE